MYVTITTWYIQWCHSQFLSSVKHHHTRLLEESLSSVPVAFSRHIQMFVCLESQNLLCKGSNVQEQLQGQKLKPCRITVSMSPMTIYIKCIRSVDWLPFLTFARTFFSPRRCNACTITSSQSIRFNHKAVQLSESWTMELSSKVHEGCDTHDRTRTHRSRACWHASLELHLPFCEGHYPSQYASLHKPDRPGKSTCAQAMCVIGSVMQQTSGSHTTHLISALQAYKHLLSCSDVGLISLVSEVWTTNKFWLVRTLSHQENISGAQLHLCERRSFSAFTHLSYQIKPHSTGIDCLIWNLDISEKLTRLKSRQMCTVRRAWQGCSKVAGITTMGLGKRREESCLISMTAIEAIVGSIDKKHINLHKRPAIII